MRRTHDVTHDNGQRQPQQKTSTVRERRWRESPDLHQPLPYLGFLPDHKQHPTFGPSTPIFGLGGRLPDHEARFFIQSTSHGPRNAHIRPGSKPKGGPRGHSWEPPGPKESLLRAGAPRGPSWNLFGYTQNIPKMSPMVEGRKSGQIWSPGNRLLGI